MNLEGHGLSYKEFAKQYQDLTDWLKAICEQLSQSNPLCLSERYLNQVVITNLFDLGTIQYFINFFLGLS